MLLKICFSENTEQHINLDNVFVLIKINIDYLKIITAFIV